MRIDRLEGGVTALPSTAQAHHVSGPGAPTSAASRHSPTSNKAPNVVRAESFADHYCQARQFFISQTMGERAHIATGLTFEISKVQTPAVRETGSLASPEHR